MATDAQHQAKQRLVLVVIFDDNYSINRRQGEPKYAAASHCLASKGASVPPLFHVDGSSLECRHLLLFGRCIVRNDRMPRSNCMVTLQACVGMRELLLGGCNSVLGGNNYCYYSKNAF